MFDSKINNDEELKDLELSLFKQNSKKISKEFQLNLISKTEQKSYENKYENEVFFSRMSSSKSIDSIQSEFLKLKKLSVKIARKANSEAIINNNLLRGHSRNFTNFAMNVNIIKKEKIRNSLMNFVKDNLKGDNIEEQKEIIEIMKGTNYNSYEKKYINSKDITPIEEEEYIITKPKQSNILAKRKLSLKGKLNLNINTTKNKKKKFYSEVKDYFDFLTFRPVFFEHNAIDLIKKSLIKIKILYNKDKEIIKERIIWTNISSSYSIPKILDLNKKLRKNPTCLKLENHINTSYSHLYFYAKKIKKHDIRFKCEFPIKGKQNRDLLQKALSLNLIKTISSYHFQCPEEFKNIENPDFLRAFNGLCTSGLNLLCLWTVLTQGYKKLEKSRLRRLINKEEDKLPIKIVVPMEINIGFFKDLYNLLCKNPAISIGIFNIKGSISVKKHADFVIWNPFDISKFGIEDIYKPHKLHIFKNKYFNGNIIKTILRGNLIYSKMDENVLEQKTLGKLIKK